MNTKTKQQLIDYIKKNGSSRPSQLAAKLGISLQALHRHLKTLCEQGTLIKHGNPPHTHYSVNAENPKIVLSGNPLAKIRSVLQDHPAICLVTLFGSQARGQARPDSDIDILIWLEADSNDTRHDIWQFWDRHSRQWSWADKVSLIVRKWKKEIFIDTLLLDFPEEHRLIYQRGHRFDEIRKAVTNWRQKWDAVKLPSFAGKHSWKYSSYAKTLEEIDFRLELHDVS